MIATWSSCFNKCSNLWMCPGKLKLTLILHSVKQLKVRSWMNLWTSVGEGKILYKHEERYNARLEEQLDTVVKWNNCGSLLSVSFNPISLLLFPKTRNNKTELNEFNLRLVKFVHWSFLYLKGFPFLLQSKWTFYSAQLYGLVKT